MARALFITPTVPQSAAKTVRLGAGNTTNDNLSDLEVGKIVSLVGESRYNLAAVGTEIEGIISSIDGGTSGGFTIGGIYSAGRAYAVADGLQGTPGTGTLAIGNVVVAGTITAKGTALATFPKVCVATTPANVVHKWRVVSLGSAGTGAVGTTVVIERI